MRFKYIALLIVSFAISAYAHVGSPDVFFQGDAGPYHIYVTVRLPNAIPGMAVVEVRSSATGISGVSIIPLYVGTEKALPPPPEKLENCGSDSHCFTGSFWLMESGSWQLQFHVNGTTGSGSTVVPVPAAARSTVPMPKALGLMLFVLIGVLAFGAVGIVGTAIRESQLPWGTMPSVSDRKRARGAMMFSGAIVGGILLLGAAWWAYEARKNAREVLYQPPPLNVSVEANSRLLLSWNYSRLRDFLNYGGTDHLMPDHGHLMHLAVLRMPHMDAFYHLHPTQTGEHEFSLDLPSVPDGDYELFADIVHGSGFAETLTAKVTLQGVHGTALTGDNAGGPTVPISGATSERTVSRFPDGSSLVWEHEDKALRANKLEVFRFEARGQDGKPLTDLENYMGMAAHAFIVRDDGTVFAHVHPSGSASMAAMEMAEKTLNPSSPDQGSMGMTMMPSAPVGPEISFPYGFPAAGKYRLFVQIKRNGVVETGVFDTVVNN